MIHYGRGRPCNRLPGHRAFSVILPKEYIYIACANMYYMLDEYSIAIEYSEKALAINENSYEGLIIKGISLGKLEDYDSLIDVLHKALEVNKTDEVYYNIGVAYHMTEKLDEAISYYDKCIEINPYFERAHLNIGVCYFAKINLEKVLQDGKIELAPKVDHVIREFGRIGIKCKQLNTQELVELYFDIYNPSNIYGQRVRTNIDDYKTAVVNPAIIEE